MRQIQLLPDWMYHTIEESFTCQFTSVPKSGMPVALPVFLNHFDSSSMNSSSLYATNRPCT